ncbi:hypothetical protein GNIT_1610 [Glaciecola nitratireducens FR1064]|uniref:Uncharacterized protein n=1 Tax=Glaciecola nitratireducens (strain JCM 12485 / KCTC 12276 / FR1064) TaxID=1085623 RepID=G4QH96_GLANF|nr:hypothetical protein GNIT_1610 [Glaciecola nitratireducens FR1064]
MGQIHKKDIAFIADRSDEDMFETPLEALLFYLNSDAYPPAYLLEWLKQTFGFYFMKGGDVELERIFGKIKPKAGNFAAQVQSQHPVRDFSWKYDAELQCAASDGIKPLTQKEFFKKWKIEFHEQTGTKVAKDVESFLRAYRKFKKT